MEKDVQINLVLPADLVSKILANEEIACKKLRELAILELVRNEEITTMHATSLMDMEWEELAHLMGEKGIPYFNQSVEEYDRQYKAYRAALKKLRSQKKM